MGHGPQHSSLPVPRELACRCSTIRWIVSDGFIDVVRVLRLRLGLAATVRVDQFSRQDTFRAVLCPASWRRFSRAAPVSFNAIFQALPPTSPSSS